MLLFKQIFIFILLKLIPIIFSTETVKTVGSNIDCSCPSEETFDSNLKEGVFKSPGFPGEYCGSLDCKWNILPEENAFIFAKLGGLFSTEKRYDILDVYQTRWNGSELMKVRQASVSGEAFVDVEVERLFSCILYWRGTFLPFCNRRS
uniref:CUB domain-containing protein n=1 Tax=Meloidogyne incognita TaxID=6306 RepID=A0A914N4G6_MELIC